MNAPMQAAQCDISTKSRQCVCVDSAAAQEHCRDSCFPAPDEERHDWILCSEELSDEDSEVQLLFNDGDDHASARMWFRPIATSDGDPECRDDVDERRNACLSAGRWPFDDTVGELPVALSELFF